MGAIGRAETLAGASAPPCAAWIAVRRILGVCGQSPSDLAGSALRGGIPFPVGPRGCSSSFSRSRGLHGGPRVEGTVPSGIVGGVSCNSPRGRRARVLPRSARTGRVAGRLVALRGDRADAAGRLDFVAGGPAPAPARGARFRPPGARPRDRLSGVRAVSLLPPVGEGQSGSEPARACDPRRLAHLRRARQRGRLGAAGTLPPRCRGTP